MSGIMGGVSSDLPDSRSPDSAGVDPYPGWSDVQLRREAEALGADLSKCGSRAAMVAEFEKQRRLVASLDEATLTEVCHWAGLTIARPGQDEGLTARKERLARQVAGLKTMRFGGLSREGLQTLALLRGIPVRGDEPIPVLVDYLKAGESLLAKLNRKRRGLLGHLAERIAGATGSPSGGEQPAPGPGGAGGPDATGSRRLKHEIEEQGLFAGITNRFKRSADTYVQEKLDEIEARIDRKLDEIDRRLGDWRDKEIANRIRIIKITLWTSVVISVLSLLYMYVKQHLL